MDDAVLHAARALAQGVSEAAVAALEAALAVHPDHPHGWRILGDARDVLGDRAGAAVAYLRHIPVSVGDPALCAAALALNDGRIADAEAGLRAILRARPTEVAAMRMLAELAVRIDRLADAEHLLDRALDLAPGFDAARHNRALVRHRRGQPHAALADIAPLAAAQPDNPAYLATLAAVLSRTGDYDRVIATYDRLLGMEGPGQDARLWMSRGHALKTVGRRDDCIAAYRRAIDLSPHLGEAWWSLANLKTYRFAPDEVARMTALLDRDLAPDDAMHLRFALGHALDAAGAAEAAFGHYAVGNRLRRATLDHDRAAIDAHVDGVCDLLTPALVRDRAGQGHDARDPIFILGMPRAGSTLVEQILASHPAVEGTMELPDIGLIAADLEAQAGGAHYLTVAAAMPGDALRALGQRYLDQTRIHRRLGRAMFVDKMPNNWAHVALIHLILPRATIVDARREPMDCCVSCYTQHFARGQGFSYDLGDLGHYYARYVRMMAHVDAVLPGRVHRVIHDRLVADPQGAIRALLAACGLDYDPACLDFHRNARPVRTPSAEQVRRPLSGDAIGTWRRFEPWLDPLKQALGPVRRSWRD